MTFMDEHKEIRRSLLILISLILIAFLFQGCAGATPTSTPLIEGSPGSPPPQESPATDAPLLGGGVLRIAMQPIVQIDPAFISSDPEVLVANAVYDYLVDVTPENTIAPRLAREWTHSEDGLTYIFLLNQGVKFHDGTPLTAEDVVWTFNRLRDPTADLPTKDLYSNISDIKASGDLEVTFTLKEANPFFLYDLSDNHALILKAGTQDAATRFNGTGPFTVVVYSPENRLVVEANPDYFIPGQPTLDGVEFIFFNDQAAQVEALKGGQVDLVMLLSTDLFVSLKDVANLTLMQTPTNGFDLVRLRSDRPPGDDPRVMQALKLATDRQAIYQLVLQGFGATGRDNPIGPLYSQYYTESFPLPERDVEAARKLLADAGYTNDLKLELHTPDTGNRPNLAVVLEAQWEEAGVEIEVVVEPESVYYGDNGWLEVDLGITGWGSRPYPQFYLDTMLVCDAVWNESHFCDAEFDRLAKVAGTTMDEQERVRAYEDIQSLLIERGPVLIPYFFAQLGAINNQFKGFQMKAFPGRSDLRLVNLVDK